MYVVFQGVRLQTEHIRQVGEEVIQIIPQHVKSVICNIRIRQTGQLQEEVRLNLIRVHGGVDVLQLTPLHGVSIIKQAEKTATQVVHHIPEHVVLAV